MSSSSDTLMDQQFLLLRKDIRSIKKQVVAANLTLTENEAVKFWPVYEQFRRISQRSPTRELR